MCRGRYLPSIETGDAWYENIQAMMREIEVMVTGFKDRGWEAEHLPSLYHIDEINGRLSVDIDYCCQNMDAIVDKYAVHKLEAEGSTGKFRNA